eukprot:3428021-Pyramimonas_sp.AAC.1
MRPFHASPIDANWRSSGNNKELNLLDIPSAQTLREWKQRCIGAVAGSWHDVKAAQTWITEAMEREVPKESLRDSGALLRLGMMIATNLFEKFAKMKRSRNLSVQRAHFLSQINRVGHSCQIEG